MIFAYQHTKFVSLDEIALFKQNTCSIMLTGVV